MSASQSVIKSSVSSPASFISRLTALSVTQSSAITMGRMCKSTSFCTYFIFESRGSFMRLNKSGTIFAPTKLWLWKVHPAAGSQRFVFALPTSCNKAAHLSHKLSVCWQMLSSTSNV